MMFRVARGLPSWLGCRGAACICSRSGGHGWRCTGVSRRVEGELCGAEDPRNPNSCEHLLFDILAIAVLSVACGADDWCGMASFARIKLDWLKTFLELPGGSPSHDTFRRVFELLERGQFAVLLFHWTQALQEATGGKLVAIDGCPSIPATCWSRFWEGG